MRNYIAQRVGKVDGENIGSEFITEDATELLTAVALDGLMRDLSGNTDVYYFLVTVDDDEFFDLHVIDNPDDLERVTRALGVE